MKSRRIKVNVYDVQKIAKSLRMEIHKNDERNYVSDINGFLEEITEFERIDMKGVQPTIHYSDMLRRGENQRNVQCD